MNTSTVQLISGGWLDEFTDWVDAVESRALLVSPFISDAPIQTAIDKWEKRGVVQVLEVLAITNLSLDNVLHGALEPSALLALVHSMPRTSVLHLPNLHAKVYVADNTLAIITSGNLTISGLRQNLEYGVRLSDPLLVRKIWRDFDDVAIFASRVPLPRLERWAGAARHLRPLWRKLERTERAASWEILHREFTQLVEEVDLETKRIRAYGQTDNSIYSPVILQLLKQYGPLGTKQLHPMIQSVLPDMCDDTIDRVIDGVHFGKRWKHMVRNAQQHLKRQGRVWHDGRNWHLRE